MDTSIFIAQLIGPLLVAIGVGMLVNAAAYQALVQDFLHNLALIFVSGMLALVGGLAIVLTHNVWTADWRVIITIFGWLAVIGGALRTILPQYVRSMGTAVAGKPAVMMAGGAVVLVLGLVLSYFGYFQ